MKGESQLRDKYDKAIKMAEGNVKHEGIYLTEYERDLIKKSLTKQLSHAEFLKLAYQSATR